MTKLEKQKGFTLIELMIVIAIIGILAAIAIPSFSSIRIKAFNSTAQADAKNGVTAAESFYIDALVYPNSATIVTGPNSISLTGTNLSTATWNLSDKVSAVFTKGATVGFCLRAKHISGDRLYMASDTTKLPIQLTALATAGAVLDAAGATSATTDCSGVIATTIAGYAIN